MQTLFEIGNTTGTDKVIHEYLPHYARRFESLRGFPVALLEIGIAQGASLRMWKEYFSQGRIYGIDIQQECIFSEERIKCFKGSQQDQEFLRQVINQVGPLDIIIDDGGHKATQHVDSFNALWDHVKPGGWYCIEDAITIFDVCWTDPKDYTILQIIEGRWKSIIRSQDDIAEVTVIGCGTQKPGIGRNNGLIFLRKARRDS